MNTFKSLTDMRKLVSFLAVAITAVMVSGCASLLASIATNPSFVVPDGTVYNGQTVRITKSGTCSYAWATSDPTHLPLVEKDGTAYITGHLDKDKYGRYESSRVATVTASNSGDATVKPIEQQVNIYSWQLAIYDSADKRIEDPLRLARNTQYTAKMVRVGGTSSSPNYVVIPKLYRSMTIGGEELISLNFSMGSSSFAKVGQSELTYTFKTPSSASSTVTLNATLGDVTMGIKIATK